MSDYYEMYDELRAEALRRIAVGLDLLDLPADLTIEVARVPRVDSAVDEAHQGAQGSGPATRPALRPVTSAGYRVASQAHRAWRIRLRRRLARLRAGAVLLAVVMVGAFAADRPIAGVLAAMLVFTLLCEAAETRAEL